MNKCNSCVHLYWFLLEYYLLFLWVPDTCNCLTDQTHSSVQVVIVLAFLIFRTAAQDKPLFPFSCLLYRFWSLVSIIVRIQYMPKKGYFSLYLYNSIKVASKFDIDRIIFSLSWWYMKWAWCVKTSVAVWFPVIKIFCLLLLHEISITSHCMQPFSSNHNKTKSVYSKSPRAPYVIRGT